MGNILLVVLAVLLVGGVVYWSYSGEPGAARLSAYSAARQSPGDVFAKVASAKLADITQCILSDFMQTYTYTEADKLITEEMFRNNKDVLAVLDKCTYNILRNLYAFFLKALDDPCIGSKQELAAEWVIQNVPYRELAREETLALLDKIRTTLGKTCWPPGVVGELVVKTKIRLEILTMDVLGADLGRVFLANQTYKDVIKTVAGLIVQTYAADAANLPGMYDRLIPTADVAFLNKHSDGKVAFLFKHVAIVHRLAPSWCRDAATLVAVASKVPFDAQVDPAWWVDAIRAEYCWDKEMFAARTRKILENILQVSK
jgi:hypothetical protein